MSPNLLTSGALYFLLFSKSFLYLVSAGTAEHDAEKGLLLGRIHWWSCPTGGREGSNAWRMLYPALNISSCLPAVYFPCHIYKYTDTLFILTSVNSPSKFSLALCRRSFFHHFSISRNIFSKFSTVPKRNTVKKVKALFKKCLLYLQFICVCFQALKIEI